MNKEEKEPKYIQGTFDIERWIKVRENGPREKAPDYLNPNKVFSSILQPLSAIERDELFKKPLIPRFVIKYDNDGQDILVTKGEFKEEKS